MHVLLYCHNVHGLGHIVRSSRIAAAVADAGGRATIVTGCASLEAVPIDARVPVVRIPPIDAKRFDHEVLRVRAARILAAARLSPPQVIVADLLPLGLLGELQATLTAAREERWATTFVWGIPYVDTMAASVAEPRNPAVLNAYRLYESAIAYMDPGGVNVFDSLPAWAVPARRAFVGVVAGGRPDRGTRSDGLIVVACGGGTTAVSLCRAAIDARRLLPEGLATRLRLFAGPLADPAAIRATISNEPGVELAANVPLEAAVAHAHVVVSRSGYNSTVELLQSEIPLILVPSSGGSGDQVTRARGLGGAPGVEIVEEGPAVTQALAHALVRALRGPAAFVRKVTPPLGAQAAARWLLDTPARTEGR